MKRIFSSILLFSFVFFSNSSFAQDNLRYSFSDLTPIASFEKEVRNKMTSELGMENSEKKMSIQRIFDSDWFSVSIDKNQYLVNNSADTWLATDFSGLFKVDNGVTPIVVSNDTRESLMRFLFFVNENIENLPYYEANQEKLVVYSFIDMTCPHCRKFHLSQKNKLKKKGVSFVYIPFLRDVGDEKARSENLGAFCGDSKETVKQKIDDVFLKPPREIGRTKVPYSCTKYESILFDFMLGNGERYNLRGSPMFVTLNGQVMYGYAALENYVKNIYL